jgi:serine/threonine-protein kinase HipA
MARRKSHDPLDVLINGRLVGQLSKANNGATAFQYDQTWLDWEPAFAISLSLPKRETPYKGEEVAAVFDNLLPDNLDTRRRIAERTGAAGADPYSLLEEIGRDCIGAMQFLHPDDDHDFKAMLEGEEQSEEEIEQTLAGLAQKPLGMDREEEFRISVPGAQEKTSLLLQEGKWLKPIGITPTTHLLKPQLGQIPTPSGIIDMSSSVDNEHYCLTLLEEFGVKVAKTWIETFGKRRVLVVERFDRLQRSQKEILRLPQEDMCQALGIPSSLKYQSNGGPSAYQILKLLQRADSPLEDQQSFLSALILFWMIGATDGHGKNFSIFLRPFDRYGLTPIYDVLTAQPAFEQRQIPKNKFKLAMSAGKKPHYVVSEVAGRHFVQTAQKAGLGQTIIQQCFERILENIETAPARALERMPKDFDISVYESIGRAIKSQIAVFKAGLKVL